MMALLRRVLLTMIALLVLVIVERSFGMIVAMVAAGVCFLIYIFLLTLRQTREEDDSE